MITCIYEGRIFRPSFKNQLILLFVSFWSFILVSSCTKEIKLEFVDQPYSLVVNSIFNPKEPFWFHFSNTIISTEKYKEFDDTLRFVLYGDNQVIFDTTITEEILITYIYPVPGIKYFFIAQKSNGESVSSADSLPRLVNIDNAKFIFPAGVNADGEGYGEAQISFTDPADEKNYYEILVFNYSQGEIDQYWSNYGDSKWIDPVLQNEGDKDYLPTSFFFSDQLIDGSQYTIHLYSSGGLGTGLKYGTTLRSVSESYYKYRKYYTRHAHNQQYQGDFLDIIFMGEPQNMFSNISNGYGIFSCYQETSAELIENK